MEVAFRRHKLLVDGGDEVVNRQTEGGSAEHPEADADAEGE
jgi:hypothetical protein